MIETAIKSYETEQEYNPDRERTSESGDGKDVVVSAMTAMLHGLAVPAENQEKNSPNMFDSLCDGLLTSLELIRASLDEVNLIEIFYL